MKKKERILATASESAILLKNISGDVYIESRAYTRWIFFEKTAVMLDKSTMCFLPNKTVLGNNLPGIVQIDVGGKNRFVNKNAALYLMLHEVKSEREYIKLICKETETTTKKYEIVLNFSNLPDKEIILKYLSDLGFEIENEPNN